MMQQKTHLTSGALIFMLNPHIPGSINIYTKDNAQKKKRDNTKNERNKNKKKSTNHCTAQHTIA